MKLRKLSILFHLQVKVCCKLNNNMKIHTHIHTRVWVAFCQGCIKIDLCSKYNKIIYEIHIHTVHCVCNCVHLWSINLHFKWIESIKRINRSQHLKDLGKFPHKRPLHTNADYALIFKTHGRCVNVNELWFFKSTIVTIKWIIKILNIKWFMQKFPRMISAMMNRFE